MNITHFLGNVYKNATFFEKSSRITLLQRSEKWLDHFFSIDVGMLLELDTSAQGFTVRKLKVFRPDTVLGISTLRTIAKGRVVEYYHSTLCHENPAKEQHKTNSYGEGVMQIPAKTSSKLDNELPEKTMDKDRVQHNVGLVPVPFYGMRYINDAGYLRDDSTQKAERLNKRSVNSVQLSQDRSPSSPEQFSIFRILSVHALRDIALSEELLIYYGNKYKPHRRSRT